MNRIFKVGMLVLVCLPVMIDANESQMNPFRGLHEFSSYKKVIDTCVRTYSDLLALEEKTDQHKNEDLVDLLVGRLVRIDNYVAQLTNEYRVHATVAKEDIEYLSRIFDYMAMSVDSELTGVGFSSRLNRVVGHIKQRLNAIPNPDDAYQACARVISRNRG